MNLPLLQSLFPISCSLGIHCLLLYSSYLFLCCTGAGSSHGDSRIELEAHNDEKTIDEVQLVRDKISSNNSAIPKGLKRMSEYISRIDKVVSLSETVRHSFKRKKKVLERSECISRIDKVVSSSETVRPAYKRKKS